MRLTICLSFLLFISYAFSSGTQIVPGSSGTSKQKAIQGQKFFKTTGKKTCQECHGKGNKFKRSSLIEKKSELSNLIQNCLTHDERGALPSIDPKTLQRITDYLKYKYKI